MVRVNGHEGGREGEKGRREGRGGGRGEEGKIQVGRREEN